MGGWVKETDADVLMEDATIEDTRTTGKCSHKPMHSEGPVVAANDDLLIENEELPAKLQDQETELTEALQQIMTTNRFGRDTKAELENFLETVCQHGKSSQTGTARS